MKRYKKYYRVNYFDKKLYDLVIDTTNLTSSQVINKIMEFMEKI